MWGYIYITSTQNVAFLRYGDQIITKMLLGYSLYFGNLVLNLSTNLFIVVLNKTSLLFNRCVSKTTIQKINKI